MREFNGNFILKNTLDKVEFYLPVIDQSGEALMTYSKNIGKTDEEEKHKHVMTTPYNLTHGVYSYYLYLLTICVQQRWPTLLIGKKSTGKTSLVHTLAKLTNNRCIDIVLSPSTDTTDILGSYQQVNHKGKAQFVWKDSVLIEAIQNGDWVIIENFNHRGGSTAIVLDRLNSLLEEDNEELVINEAGLIEGELKKVKAHPNFRIFFLLNEETMMYSTISKPLRNRCCEIHIRDLEYSDIEATIITVCNNMGVHGTKIPLSLFEIHKKHVAKDGEITDYKLQLFFKWVQNICNSHKFAQLKI
jgi:midasin (ATPase involved in ribosome maturation)